MTPIETGDNWFLIDESGDFTLDSGITATIWLVGGGCDGTGGVWNGNTVHYDETLENNDADPDTGTDSSISGSGGDGGFVYTAYNVKIPQNTTLTSVIAERNDKEGTSLKINGTTYSCDQLGYVYQEGGAGGIVPLPKAGQKWADQSSVAPSKGGKNGVSTPYGYVGSSGGGGASCNGTSDATNGIEGGTGAGDGQSHRLPGTSATNYGCGGGGGAVCGRVAQGFPGGQGKKGCIIISYVIYTPTIVVQNHYKKVFYTNKTCNTDYYSSSGSYSNCGRSSNGCGCNKDKYTDTIHIGTST